jgi:hypothetical protein
MNVYLMLILVENEQGAAEDVCSLEGRVGCSLEGT